MTISEIVKLIVDNGVTIAILGYFCIRDWKFMSTLTELLTTLKSQTEHIAHIIEKEKE